MTNVFSWRDAILEAKLPAPTKLLLLTLSTYMNDRGDKRAWPSQKTLSAETSLSTRTIINHIGIAVAAGFLVKKKRDVQGSHWDANEYHATFPDGMNLLHPSDVRMDEPAALGGVNDVHINKPLEQPIRKEANASKSRFDEFWQHFPKQRAGKKDKAKSVWLRIITEGTDPKAIIDGVIAYAASDEVARGYAKGAAAWLNDDRWTVNYRRGPGKPQTTDKGIPVLSEYDRNPML